MEKILRKVEKLIPKKIYSFFQPAYHFMWAILGAVIYRFPSRNITVIGITGTKGKSSSTEILNAILEEAGYTTAISGTIRFKIGNEERPNKFKMSMPGRMFMQKFLRDAVNAGCTHAIIETTSEGAKMFRHFFIGYDALIFLNLSPEHIESHGSYENYVNAKLSIGKQVARSVKSRGVIIGNVDDAETPKFFSIASWNPFKKMSYVPYSLKDLTNYQATDEGIEYVLDGQKITSPLKGIFNIYNSLACATAAKYFGISLETVAHALKNFGEIKGRVHFVIPNTQPFDAVVDYAHTADSLRQLYETFPERKKVCVLGSTGGGRDMWKRPEMGKMADTHCDYVILTNEDPYDEDPMNIIADVKKGITTKPCEVILDRREAIAKALLIAKSLHSDTVKKPIVLITGKGTDPYIMVKDNKKIPWSDYEVTKEEIEKLN